MFLITKFFMAIITVEALTEIITKSEIFRPIKAKIFNFGKKNKFFKWLHDLLDCGYCFSVWAAMLVSILFFKDLHLLHWSVDWFFIGIVLHRLSNLFHNIIDRVHGIE